MCSDISKGGRKRNVIRNTSPHPLSPALPLLRRANLFSSEGVAQTQKPLCCPRICPSKENMEVRYFLSPFHPSAGDGTKLTDVTCSTPKRASYLPIVADGPQQQLAGRNVTGHLGGKMRCFPLTEMAHLSKTS
ncbi:hypothetical protein AVEN_272880-1 [Araneus ventricosus]|uniref:Uncharacterized protein n=1 Tax=Araneus ventricosus TaxID=182803 RepID=A0A4Y2S0B5_ARAVE|nr:hypothetical protein AVEN_218431-1 [Araneus ventricosus]GBN81441.1 hypothetical protein AVEN_272880-1 [Araneus ventricosus]